ncbi:MAG TPA: vanadium-dependent haloperoxidase [Gemmatimonadaceae bacterium]|nr:vanadium-dependent haloperoxidase [Gemmatimonadaceae bacterium]
MTVEPVALPQTANAGAVKFWDSNAAVYWNGVARQLIATYRLNALVAIRGYSIVSVAQYNAAIAAEKEKERGKRPSVHAAISAASVVALSYLHPAEASALETELTQYLAQEGWPGEHNTDEAAGVEIGRAIAAQIVARAQTDRFFDPWTGTVPTGPGKWFSATPPVGATVGQAKTYFLTSGNQFRPVPPPVFGSPAFNAAVAEVRQISDTRTPEQTAIAVFWNLPAGTHQPPGYWNEEAAKLAVQYRLNERETAHTFALMNMVSYDALVASHEAKFHYWLLRPTMADPGITLPIGLPNFPSYPSNHAAISAGMARVLGDRFPSEVARLDALADEAALSRVFGGIHYRFDGDAGLTLGRTVAAWALANDVNGHEPFVLQ